MDGGTVNPNPEVGSVWVYYGHTLGGGWSGEPIDTSLGIVVSFNGRNGEVQLVLSDVTGAGGAPTVSPHLTGVPTAPTAPDGTSTTQLATTAFVSSAIGNVVIAAGPSAVVAGPGLTGGGNTGTVTLSLATPVSIANGGTAAATAAQAVTNLGAVHLSGDTMTGDLAIVPGDGGAARFTVDAGWTQLTLSGASGRLLGLGSDGTGDGFVWSNTGDLFLESDGGDVTIRGASASIATFAQTGIAFLAPPTAPNPSPAEDSTRLATTAWVKDLIDALPPPAGGASVTVSDTAPVGAVVGDLWFDSIAAQLYVRYNDGTSAQWVAANSLGGAAPSAYSIGFSFVGGVLGNSQLLGLHQVAKAVTFQANFGAYAGSASQFGATANATASTVIRVDRALAASPNTFNQIGAITVAAGGVAATFTTTGGASISLAQGDVVRLTGPATADATLANPYVTLVAQEV